MVGVADFNCTNETKLEILELVKRETERRSQQKNALKKKSTMRQGKRYKYILNDFLLWKFQTWTQAS